MGFSTKGRTVKTQICADIDRYGDGDEPQALYVSNTDRYTELALKVERGKVDEKVGVQMVQRENCFEHAASHAALRRDGKVGVPCNHQAPSHIPRDAKTLGDRIMTQRLVGRMINTDGEDEIAAVW